MDIHHSKEPEFNDSTQTGGNKNIPHKGDSSPEGLQNQHEQAYTLSTQSEEQRELAKNGAGPPPSKPPPERYCDGIVISFRITPSQLALIDRECPKGMSRNEYVRARTFKRKLKVTVAKAANRHVVNQLARIGNNINQIAKGINQANYVGKDINLAAIICLLQAILDEIHSLAEEGNDA